MDSMIAGKVKNARHVQAQDGSYEFYAFDVASESGTTFACQMWPDDPDYANVVQNGASLKGHSVSVVIDSYSIGTRNFKDGTSSPQVRFRVTNFNDYGRAASGGAQAA